MLRKNREVGLTSRDWLTLLTFLTLLACALSVVVLSVVGDPLSAAVATAGSTAFVAYLIIFVFFRGVQLTPIFWLTSVWVVFFFAKPLYDIANNDRRQQLGFFVGATYPAAIYIACLGLGALVMGFCLPPLRRRRGRRQREGRVVDSALRKLCSAVVLLTLVCYGLFGLFLAQAGAGGVQSLLLGGRSQQLAGAYERSSGFTYSAPLWLFSPAMLLLCCALGSAKSPARQTAIRVALGVMLLSQLPSLAFGDRSFFLTAVLSLSIIVLLRIPKNSRISLIVVGLPTTIYLGVLAPRVARDSNNSVPVWNIPEVLAGQGGIAAAFLSGQDTAMAKNLALEISAIPTRLDHTLGFTYLSFLTRFLPRQIFDGNPIPFEKPSTGDEYLSDLLINSQTGIKAGFAFSFFGEPYLNFGTLGVVAVSLLFGWLSRWGWQSWRDAPDNPLIKSLYFSLLPLSLLLMRGGLTVGFHRVMFIVVPALLLWFFLLRQTQQVQPSNDLAPEAAVRSARNGN